MPYSISRAAAVRQTLAAPAPPGRPAPTQLELELLTGYVLGQVPLDYLEQRFQNREWLHYLLLFSPQTVPVAALA